MNVMLLLAQVAPALTDSIAGANPVLTQVNASDEMNLWSMAVKGGWIMVVLGLMSVLCFYILFERNYVIRKAGKEDPQFMDKIKATISGGAPMLGFLGTVTGMVRAFWQMANAGNNIDITLLSGGIYEAMITTVGGLIVGIIAMFAYNYLVTLIDGVVNKMEAKTMAFMDLLNEPAK